jgi:hypothetical protein
LNPARVASLGRSTLAVAAVREAPANRASLQGQRRRGSLPLAHLTVSPLSPPRAKTNMFSYKAETATADPFFVCVAAELARRLALPHRLHAGGANRLHTHPHV